jgi:hypothetical protein
MISQIPQTGEVGMFLGTRVWQATQYRLRMCSQIGEDL